MIVDSGIFGLFMLALVVVGSLFTIFMIESGSKYMHRKYMEEKNACSTEKTTATFFGDNR